MRRNSPLVQRGGETDMESAMTPMIDVVFLLLVFFVWTASFQVVEQILPSRMSAQIGSEPVDNVEPPPPKDFQDIVIRLSTAGNATRWTVNEQPAPTLQAVQQQLDTIAEIQPAAVVILHPEPNVPLGDVIEAYDVAKVAGFTQVSFAVNPPQR